MMWFSFYKKIYLGVDDGSGSYILVVDFIFMFERHAKDFRIVNSPGNEKARDN